MMHATTNATYSPPQNKNGEHFTAPAFSGFRKIESPQNFNVYGILTHNVPELLKCIDQNWVELAILKVMKYVLLLSP